MGMEACQEPQKRRRLAARVPVRFCCLPRGLTLPEAYRLPPEAMACRRVGSELSETKTQA